MKKLRWLLGTGLALGLTFSMGAKADAVDLELILLADVSGSISDDDFALQRDGYEAAFRNLGVIDNIENGAIGSIVATLVYWSGTGQQNQIVYWTEITDAASSNAFADAIAAAGRPFSGGTAMADALTFATDLITDDNEFEGTRVVIDVSGDGSDGDACSFDDLVCDPVQDARDAALAAGADSINALWIEDPPFFCEGGGCNIAPLAYGTTNVIGGTDPFQIVVGDFDDFSAAVQLKIFKETGGVVPEPASLLLLGSGLIGFGLARRKTRA